MADGSIDQLRISIEAKAAGAKSELSGLSSDIRKLGNGVTSTTSKLNGLSDAIGSIGKRSAAASTLGGVANAIQKLSGAKVSSSIANQLNRISSSMSGLGNVGNVNKLSEALSSLQGKNVESTLGNRLKKVAEGAKALNDVNLDPSKTRQLAEAIEELSGVKATGVTSTVNAMRKLPEAAKALHSVDFAKLATDAHRLTLALNELPQKAVSIRAAYSGVGSQASRSMAGVSSATESAAERTNTLLGKMHDLAETITTLSIVRNAVVALTNGVSYFLDSANKYVEDMNLVNVAMGEYADQAKKYASVVYSALGVAPQDFLRAEGTFTTMARGMGIASNEAATMGQQLTQLSYDLASFYNISTDEALEKVRAGLAGEIKPLRELGYDLSEARLKEEALALGIDESVESMTQAEKALLRYRAMLSQVSWAQGDMARTLESPANMLRVFQSNVSNAARSIGTIFLPMVKAIMPAAIAAAKVVATLANMIANLTGGTQLAAVNYGGGTSVSGGDDSGAVLPSGDTGGPGGSGGSDNNPTAKKYKDVGDAAKDAAENVKELKRQVLGFDEINKFSEDSVASGSKGSGDSGSGSPSSGSGGSGSGGGAGGGAGSGGSMPIQTYDFLGNAKGVGDDIFNALMEVAKRAAKALDPLVEAVRQTVAAIGKQFEGLDIAGALANEVVAAVNLFSNFARNVVEVLGPVAVAFNFPETAAYAFDLAAQMMLTFSAAVNGVGTMIGNFSREAVLPLVSWIGDKLRGAIKVCIDVLSTWQTWFMQNTQALANLGKAAGDGADMVLSLARAVADPMFSAAAVAFEALNSGVQVLLTAFVNSNGAIVAAKALGAAISAWAVGGAIESGLNGIAGVFSRLASVIAAHNAQAGQTRGVYDGISGAANNLHDSAWLLSQEMGTALAPAMKRVDKYMGAVNGSLANLTVRFSNARGGAGGLVSAIANLNGVTSRARTYHNGLRQSLDENNVRLKLAKADARDASAAYVDLADRGAGRLERANAKLAEKVAQANVKIQTGKTEMSAARLSSAAFATSEDAAAIAAAGVGNSSRDAAAKIVVGTTAKVAATTASKGLAIGEKAAAVATGLFSAAANAIPGMALATILGELALHFSDIASWVRNATSGFADWLGTLGPVGEAIGAVVRGIGDLVGWLGDLWGQLTGTADATGTVTDTTQEATQVLTEEQQAVKDNVDAIDEYDKSHDNLRDAIELSNYSVEDWAQHLEDIGTTFDDVMQKQETFVDSTVNGFDQIDTSSQLSLDQVNANLSNNLEIQQQWSSDIQALMALTGEGMDSSLITSLESAGASKMGAALHEVVTNPTSEKSQEWLRLMRESGSAMGPELAESLKGGAQVPQDAAWGLGNDTVDALGQGIEAGSDEASQSASDVDDATVQKFGSHYNEAKDAGRNVAGGFGDGVREASADASRPAGEVSQAVVDALNGGNGYAAAVDAGRNLVGGFGDGIREATGAAASAASSSMGDVVSSLNGGAGYNEARSAGANMLGGFADGLRSGIPVATQAGRSAAESAQQGMGSNHWGAYDAGKNEMGGFVDGLRDAMGSQAWQVGRDAAVSAQDGAGSNYWGAYSAGSNFGYGYADGISSTSDVVWERAYNLASSAVRAANAAQQSASPSRLMRRAGRWFGEGYGLGIESTGSLVADKARSMVGTAMDAVGDMREAGELIGSALGDGIEGALGYGRVTSAVTEAIGSAEASARIAVSSGALPSYTPSRGASGSHASFSRMDKDAVVKAITEAVERGVLSVSMAGEQRTAGGDSTIVIRVDGEELARAVAKGNDRLARRGVLAL